ncbi:MAG: hypothetical protein ABWZ99_06700 [Ilumatobacteraceae bacterium]
MAADTAGTARRQGPVRVQRHGGHLSTTTSHRSGLLALVSVGLLAVATGCSDEQRRDLGEEDIRQSLTEHVEQVADAQGLEIDGDLTCTADITAESALTASCDGTTSSGAAVSGTFEGTADMETDAEVCTAQLIVLVDQASVADEPDVDCFTGP